MTTCTTPRCDRPTTDMVCRSCVGKLMHELRAVADLGPELEITRCRQDVLSRTGGRQAPGSRPLLPNEAAADATWVLHNTLGTWARDLWETNGHRVPTCSLCGVPGYLHAQGPERWERDWPDMLDVIGVDDTSAALAAWIGRRPSWVANHVDGGTMVDELCAAIRCAVHAIDRPAHRTAFEVGPCPEQVMGDDEALAACPGTVSAFIPTEDDRPAVMRCDTCPAEWGATQWYRVGKRMLKVMGRDVA